MDSCREHEANDDAAGCLQPHSAKNVFLSFSKLFFNIEICFQLFKRMTSMSVLQAEDFTAHFKGVSPLK